MVLGADVDLEEVAKLDFCGVVGRLVYPYLCKGSFLIWLEHRWKTFLGYSPKIFHLSKGWLDFICRSPEDVTRLLDSTWLFGGCSLLLKHWRVAFDPEKGHF